jgi:UDP-N-acetylglucosamine--dolichyl-phosphate N-acetylglucosaminephosphotransferase
MFLVEKAFFGLVSYFATVVIVPALGRYTLEAGLCGKDLNKLGQPLIPEAGGVAAGAVFLIVVILSQAYQWVGFANETATTFVIEYYAALASICFMTLLGFADDVLDLPWRYKLVFPALATLPLLMAYDGPTGLVVPIPLRPLLGVFIELSFLYKIYMLLVAIFCTNAINIHAGINGLEAGQALIIACSIALHNLLELDGEFTRNHVFSLCLIVPFIGVTLGLLRHNSYPATIFVGDTFTFLAGMTLATVAILSHVSKTLMLFFLPQILNFLISFPQIVFWECPRHRLPKFNPETKCLEAVPTHWNLLNQVLRVVGPCREKRLTQILLGLQVAASIFAFLVRYWIAAYFYSP